MRGCFLMLHIGFTYSQHEIQSDHEIFKVLKGCVKSYSLILAIDPSAQGVG